MPRVAVIIPCYNHGRHLDDAVASVLAQTFGDFEIFVVNDGSTDAFTVNLLKDYRRDKTTVLHKENGHLSSARNHGIKNSRSEFILTLDADDRFAPGFLEAAVKILDDEPRTGVVTCWTQCFGMKHHLITHKTGGGTVDFLSQNRCAASCLFRRRCWEDAGGYDETMKLGYEDWSFWIAVTGHGWSVHCIPQALFFYRVAESSMVTGSDQIRPKLTRAMVHKHLAAYREHVEDVICEKERIIQKLGHNLDDLRGSAAYRAGRCLTNPLAACRGVLKRLGMKTKQD